jgi:hypothetical protein
MNPNFRSTLYRWHQKAGTYILVDIVVPIFVERLPGMRKGGGHHVAVPPLLRELTILNTNTTTPPSLG